jgi:UDP-N-acetylmuramate--alanine ligase
VRSERDGPVTTSQPLHFVGISGIGMSALARILHARGIAVSGCSDQPTDLMERLAAEGIGVCVGHAPDHVDGIGTLVISTAIAFDHVEIAAARERDIPVIGRGALLASLMRDSDGIAVAGTHGKTTTTAMLASILEAANWDPTVVVGGELADGLNARSGSGRWFVAESDESDGSFLSLRPRVAVVTNVENDHVTSDSELDALVAAFDRFLAGLDSAGVAVVGVDEPRAAALAAQQRAARTVTFGFAPAAMVRARDVRYAGFASTFTLERGGVSIGTASLPVPGAINVLNALAAATAALEIGVPFAAIAEALARFHGVRRRFDVLARTARMTVVDDYAHHPTAVEATIAAARAGWDGPVVVAFQPHRYSRTQYLAHDFAVALRGADLVVLTEIYAASESPIAGVDASLIGQPLREFGTTLAEIARVEDLPDVLLELAPQGALVLMLGAGTISLAAQRLAARLDGVAARTGETPR